MFKSQNSISSPLKKEISNKTSRTIIFILIIIQFIGLLAANFKLSSPPMGDAIAYQVFIEDIFKGKLNFSLGGFQGSSLPAILLHKIFPSAHSFSLTQLFFAILLIPLIYIVTKRLFNSNFFGVVTALFVAMNPEIIFSGFFGYPQAVFHFLTLLTLLLVLSKNKYSFIFLGWSLISKPFSAALFPFFLYKKQLRQYLGGLIIGGFYLFIQYLFLGRIMIGVHPEIQVASVIRPARFLYNLASAPPLLFSIHNYLVFSEITTIGDRFQTSPFLVIFSIFSAIYLSRMYKSKKVFKTLVWFALLSFLLPASLSYLDTNYLQTFIFAVILLSLPFFKKYPIFLPITVATLSYQYLFTFIAEPSIWPPPQGYLLFSIPIIGFLISCYLVKESLLAVITSFTSRLSNNLR
jgi:hypothetical protein